eukprot:TRINITY_DN12920_c0_g1_i1.p1 TRINITY_DN12920_c0_g1~~TRINITY_DN12920_c0_g1_i1.p1  ORF type:complete len:362 (+),score=122.06 TRINITY_DN12920_c0_g1_i1:57-1142(+)
MRPTFSPPWGTAAAGRTDFRWSARCGGSREFLTFSTRDADLQPFGIRHNDAVRFTVGPWRDLRAHVLGVHKGCAWVCLEGDDAVTDLKHCSGAAQIQQQHGLQRITARDARVSAVSPVSLANAPWNEDHGNGNWREVVFCCNDGATVSACVLTGAVVLGCDSSAVLLSGVLALIAGATTVACAEWASATQQRELEQKELECEKAHLREHPDDEARNLTQLLSEFFSDDTNRRIHADTQGQLEAQLRLHGKLEFGVDLPSGQQGDGVQVLDRQHRTAAVRAAFRSLLCFSCGALLPTVAWMVPEMQLDRRVAVMYLLLVCYGVVVGVWSRTARVPWWLAVLRHETLTFACVALVAAACHFVA